jgi:hypothetical protein
MEASKLTIIHIRDTPQMLTTEIKAKKLQAALADLSSKYPKENGLFLAKTFFEIWFKEELTQ